MLIVGIVVVQDDQVSAACDASCRSKRLGNAGDLERHGPRITCRCLQGNLLPSWFTMTCPLGVLLLAPDLDPCHALAR